MGVGQLTKGQREDLLGDALLHCVDSSIGITAQVPAAIEPTRGGHFHCGQQRKYKGKAYCKLSGAVCPAMNLPASKLVESMTDSGNAPYSVVGDRVIIRTS